MAYEQILYEIDENILTITLNRPDRLNAFTQIMRDELIDGIDRGGLNGQLIFDRRILDADFRE